MELLVVIAIIAVLAGLAVPTILKVRKAGALTEAGKNSGQVATALMSFEDEYGTFPTQETVQALKEVGVENVRSGTTANALLSQLLAAGSVDTEKIFFAKGAWPGVKKPDGKFRNAQDQLSKGELGFGYVMSNSSGGRVAVSGAGSRTPVVVAPLIKGGSSPTFNIGPYGGKGVAAYLDSSFEQLKINEKTKKISIGGGQTLFSTGASSEWERYGLNPFVVEPE